MVSQSGGFGYSMVGLAEEAGLGFRKIISIGNEAGLNSVELMRYYVEDSGTKVIVTYLEGLRDADVSDLIEILSVDEAKAQEIHAAIHSRKEVPQKEETQQAGSA